MNRRFLTVSLPNPDPKAQAFLVRSKEALKPVTVEELVSEAESQRKKLNIAENDVIFLAGEIRFPVQFALGRF